VPAVEITAAQYGWNRNAVDRSVPMPNLTPRGLQQIQQRAPDYVVMLSPTGHEFGAALAALARVGLDPSIVRSATLQHGAVTVFVQIVRVVAVSRPDR
jgi:hypothetical protein